MMGLIALIQNDIRISGIDIPTVSARLKILQFADDTNMFPGKNLDFMYTAMARL